MRIEKKNNIIIMQTRTKQDKIIFNAIIKFAQIILNTFDYHITYLIT